MAPRLAATSSAILINLSAAALGTESRDLDQQMATVGWFLTAPSAQTGYIFMPWHGRLNRYMQFRGREDKSQ